MQTLKVMILAIVQGLAEFLPVSSSGHLVLAGNLLGVEKPGVGLEVCLHAGTLLSVLLFYRKRIAELVSGFFRGNRDSWLYAGFVLISIVPAGIAYKLFKGAIYSVYEAPKAVAALLVANGILLLLFSVADRRSVRGNISPMRALAMGVGQAVALLPGVSRSGTSILAGRLAGTSSSMAAEFSFLMSIPVILGATILEIAATDNPCQSMGVPVWTAICGALLSGAVGYVALRSVVGLIKRGRFWCFGVYCLAAGVLALVIL